MATYIQIGSTVTVGSGGTSSIDFTSIPSTYTDLLIVASVRTSRTDTKYGNMKVKFNTSTSNITGKFIRGIDASTVQSFSTTAAEWSAPTSLTTSNTFGNAQIYIPNYAGSAYKSVSLDSVIEDNSSNQFNYLSCALWSVTDAITSLSLYTSDAGQNIVQYSTASLYGIKKD